MFHLTGRFCSVETIITISVACFNMLNSQNRCLVLMLEARVNVKWMCRMKSITLTGHWWSTSNTLIRVDYRFEIFDKQEYSDLWLWANGRSQVVYVCVWKQGEMGHARFRVISQIEGWNEAVWEEAGAKHLCVSVCVFVLEARLVGCSNWS